jgi:hypothetical protein
MRPDVLTHLTHGADSPLLTHAYSPPDLRGYPADVPGESTVILPADSPSEVDGLRPAETDDGRDLIMLTHPLALRALRVARAGGARPGAGQREERAGRTLITKNGGEYE